MWLELKYIHGLVQHLPSHNANMILSCSYDWPIDICTRSLSCYVFMCAYKYMYNYSTCVHVYAAVAMDCTRVRQAFWWTLSYSYKTLVGVHEMYGWMHPQLRSCNQFVGPWTPHSHYYSLPCDHPHPSGSWQFAFKNVWLLGDGQLCIIFQHAHMHKLTRIFTLSM